MNIFKIKYMVLSMLLLIIIFALTLMVFLLAIKNKNQIDLPTSTTNAAEIEPNEVSKHNSVLDCWVAIGGSVFSLDRYFSANQDNSLASQLCGKIEPDVKLPPSLAKDKLITYRIGILTP